jgi:hypothetical protein
MSEITDQDMGDLATKAQAASDMMNSAVFNEAFQLMNQNIVNQIIQSPAEAVEERERLYSMYKSGQLFVQQFLSIINDLNLRQQQEGA